ncbi:MAG: hypothetical protein QG578_1393 [Thermodesulfobacteriota bacterium]|nr:hypothetical protein [Thermodesulfobacteriota bacterium]
MRSYINELYAGIEKDAELKNNVKIIGIAVGNNKFDIDFVEKKYDFPIVPDEKFEFHHLVGEPPTPFFIFARPYGKGRLLVVDSFLGRLEDKEKLFSMVKNAFKLSTAGSDITINKKPDEKAKEELVLPVTESELMEKVSQSLAVEGKRPGKIEKINLKELGDVYTWAPGGSARRVFARVVARKIPCVDCHDVFYIYSFDDTGKFIKFIPISISKLDNEKWDEKDINKMQNNFTGKSLLKERPFNAKVDAVSSATISSKLIYNSMGETGLVMRKLIDMGYIKR